MATYTAPHRTPELRPLRDAARAVDGRVSWRSAAGSTRAGCFGGIGARRPQPLTLVPKLKRPPATRAVHRLRGRRGRRQGHAARAWPRSICVRPGTSDRDARAGRHRAGREDPPGAAGPRTPGRWTRGARRCLFAAARAQSVTTVIRPALAEGKIVICDRYVDSSLAYQGWARGLGEQDVLTLNVWATQGLFPDLVILLHAGARARAAALDRGARPHGDGGPGLPREGRGRLPQDRRGAPGAVRRGGCRRRRRPRSSRA